MISMRRRLSGLIELANEDCQDRPSEGDDSQQPEAIEEAEHGGLSLHDGADLRVSAGRSVGSAVTALDQSISNSIHCGVHRAGAGDVRDEHGLMELGTTRQHGRNKGDAEAAALISKEICEARSLIVFAGWQV